MPYLIGDLLVGGVVLLIVVLALRSLKKDKKNGKACGCGCENCKGCH